MCDVKNDPGFRGSCCFIRWRSIDYSTTTLTCTSQEGTGVDCGPRTDFAARVGGTLLESIPEHVGIAVELYLEAAKETILLKKKVA